jgi:hypothetical protein
MLNLAARTMARQQWFMHIQRAMEGYTIASLVDGTIEPGNGGGCTVGATGLSVDCSAWEAGNDALARIAMNLDRFGPALCPGYLMEHGCIEYEDILDASVATLLHNWSELYGEWAPVQRPTGREPSR